MIRRRAAPALFALIVGTLAPRAADAQEPPRPRTRAFVEQVRDAERAILRDIDDAARKGDEDRVVEGLAEILSRAAGPEGSSLLEVEPDHFRGLRAVALERALALPATARAKLTRLEDGATRALLADRASEEADEIVVRRFPLSSAAPDAARRLAELAFESGDDVGALALDRLSDRLSGATPLGALARRAVIHARSSEPRLARGVLAELVATARAQKKDVSALAASVERVLDENERAHKLEAPPATAVLRPIAVEPLVPEEGSGGPVREPSHFEPTRTERLALASNGARVLAIDLASGRVVARMPIRDDTAAPPPPIGVDTRVTVAGGLLLAPLFTERWLLPSRSVPPARDGQDPALVGSFYSLFAFEEEKEDLHMVFCDGDAGRTSAAREPREDPRPPGFEAADAETAELLRRAHVAGPVACCGRRIYLPLVRKGAEPEIWVAALEMRTGESQPFAPRPIWRTFVASTPRAAGRGVEAPPVAARLAVDASGHVIVATDQGVVAGIDARTGALDWAIRWTPPSDGPLIPRLPRGPRGRRASSDITHVEPPLIVGRPGKPPVAVTFAPFDDEHPIVAFDVEQGGLVWRAASGDATRLMTIGEGSVLAYGGHSLVPLDGVSGCRLATQIDLPSIDQSTGVATMLGSHELVLPLGAGYARRLSIEVQRAEAGRWVEIGFRIGGRLELPRLATPANLLGAGATRLIAASSRKLAVYEWVEPR